MLGAAMRATGNMGEMSRSVWSEGSVAGTGKVAQAVVGNALNTAQSTASNFKLNLNVDGKAYSIQIDSKTTPDDMAKLFKQAGIGENVAGMIGNAMRSHMMSGEFGTNQPLDIRIDT